MTMMSLMMEVTARKEWLPGCWYRPIFHIIAEVGPSNVVDQHENQVGWTSFASLWFPCSTPLVFFCPTTTTISCPQKCDRQPYLGDPTNHVNAGDVLLQRFAGQRVSVECRLLLEAYLCPHCMLLCSIWKAGEICDKTSHCNFYRTRVRSLFTLVTNSLTHWLTD